MCLLISSTHIVEVGGELKSKDSNIRFLYMPTVMIEKTLFYPYLLKPGVSADRHGMMIIENEVILNLLGQESL